MTSRETHITTTAPRCTFIPPWLAERVDGPERAALDESLRTRRGAEASSARRTAVPGGPAWTVHDADSTTSLPGTPVRSAGDPETGDVAVDEAATGIEATLAMFAQAFSRDSHDDARALVSLTVHYGSRYNNAFWDGTQLVFGDGDGRVFERFTKPVDVLAHEFSHALVEHTAGLVYRGQPGALNESVCDVFASCLKQRLLGQGAPDGDWLIGEGIFMPSINARALRDMAAPGTAYDDPELGADPQVGHLDDYIETSDDNGGVHLNSGIPNKAFQLAAVAVGGSAIEGAGRIWYDALVGDAVPEDADFATFAAATVAAAGQHADAVREAWAEVGVVPRAVAATAAGVLRVRRTGGFAGLTTSSEVDLASRGSSSEHVRDLLGRLPAASAPDDDPMPDGYVYEFQLDDAEPVRVPEQQLTEDLEVLARGALERGDGSAGV